TRIEDVFARMGASEPERGRCRSAPTEGAVMRRTPVLTLLAHLAIVGAAAAQAPRLDVNGDPLPEGAVARLGTLRFQPQGESRAVALSPDGTTVARATRGDKGTDIDLLDTSTGKSVRRLRLADVDAARLRFTPDSKGLVFSGWNRVVIVDALTGAVTRS